MPTIYQQDYVYIDVELTDNAVVLSDAQNRQLVDAWLRNYPLEVVIRVKDEDGAVTAIYPVAYVSYDGHAVSFYFNGIADPFVNDIVPAEDIELSAKTLTVTAAAGANHKKKLEAILTPVDATTAVTWSSSAEGKATVSDDGEVTGVEAGSATITATAGSLTATCTVTVS